MTSEVVMLAIIAMISPLLMSYLTNRHRRETKAEDWARQDEVAARAERQDKRVAVAAAEQQGMLEQIHTLVNSQLTMTMDGLLTSLIGQLALLHRDPSDADKVAIKILEPKIAELETQIAERKKQTLLADAQRADAHAEATAKA